MKNKSQFSLESSQQLHCRVGQFSRHPQQFCCQTAPPPFFCSQLKEKRFACHLSGLALPGNTVFNFKVLTTLSYSCLSFMFSQHRSCQLTNQSFALLSLFRSMYKMQFQGISRECISCHSTTGLLPFCSIPPVSLYAQFSPSMTYFGVFPFVKLLVSTLCPLCQHVLTGSRNPQNPTSNVGVPTNMFLFSSLHYRAPH